MDYLPNFLSGLRGQEEYFRFIDYDNHVYGSHSKIYSWVKVKNLKLQCSSNPNEKIMSEMRLFPEDIKWKPRNVKVQAPKSKLIR